MRQERAIVVKELRQHWDMFLLLLGVQAVLAWLVARGLELSESSVTVFEAVPSFLILFMPISILLLCRRFFVSEYQKNTRDFLDALPVSRGKMLLLKFLLAFILLSLIFLSLVAIVASAARDNQPVTGLFLCILSARGLGYVFCGLCFCFMVSFTGRFLNTSYFVAMLSLIALDWVTDLSPTEIGPLGLVSARTMPYERLNMPWEFFWQSVGFGFCCAAVGFFLALSGGGSLIRALSGRMTLKEKCAAGLGFLLITALMNTVDLRRKKEPLSFVSEMVVKSESAQVEVLYLDSSQEEDAEQLRAWLEKKIVSLEEDVLGRKAPPVRVALSLKLDGRTFDAANTAKQDGVLWRCNYLLDDFDRARFGGLVFHSVLNRATRGMAVYDPQHWFLDGFAMWWAEREQPERLLEASWVVERFPMNAGDLRDWSILTDRFGSVHGESIGFSLVHQMEEQFGEAAVIKLAQSLYTRVPYYDVRERVVQWWNPIHKSFEESTGDDYQVFLEAWLSLQVEVEKEARSKIPECDSNFEFDKDTLVYTLKFSSPPPPETRWSLSHVSLKPYDTLVNEDNLKRQEHTWVEGDVSRTERLEDTYSSGQRVLLFIEVELPHLRSPLQLPSQRLEVP